MSPLSRTLDLSTLGAVVIGLLLLVLGLQVDGFVGGMGQGAGAALVVLGAVLLLRRRRGPDRVDHGWLPSRDGER
ncbi:hypothetical protein I601_1391 [Nocardioides dokdonensis FR1436]|uniref:Uncharacterized protein n=1 Tax=Nocardioides dokdonensis FR1436 TaxID=1300347 RepID=A0A1A9GJH7_9ACTN|nr:hypothetical protein [Nocardioides dokdonensis]ANH37830.1 hypothetical protein I601_1391 [Nocardioides dokdonensis FR1436]